MPANTYSKRLSRRAWNEYRNRNYSASIELWRRVLSRSPEDDQAMSFLALALSDSGDSRQAAYYYQRAFEIASKDWEIAAQYVECLLRLERTEDAIRVAESLVGHRAETEGPPCKLSFLMASIGEYGLAIRFGLTAISALPNDPHLYYNLSYWEEYSGNIGGALAVMKIAMAMNPEDEIFTARMREIEDRWVRAC